MDTDNTDHDRAQLARAERRVRELQVARARAQRDEARHRATTLECEVATVCAVQQEVERVHIERVADLRRELEASRVRARQAEDAIDKAEAVARDLQRSELRLASTTAALHDAKAEIHARREQVRELEAANERLSRVVSEHAEARLAAVNRAEKAEHDRDTRMRELAGVRADLDSRTRELAEVRAELDALGPLRALHATHVAELVDARQELAEVRAKLERLAERVRRGDYPHVAGDDGST